MVIMIVNFKLDGITDARYVEACEKQFAPKFLDMPGLISKVWLRNPETNTYGGIYTWRDRQSMEAYKSSAIFQGIGRNPNFTDVSVSEFGVVEAATEMTNGMAMA